MKRPINPNISPNLENVDLANAFKMIFSPSSILQGAYAKKVENWFAKNFNAQYAFTFAAARQAEYAVLKASGISKNDEVLVQAFTCSAVVEPIISLGAKPIYVDIDQQTLSMNAIDAAKKISKKTKAVILQHTFGVPGDIEGLEKLAKDHNLLLIEDCAHIIKGEYKNKKLGTFSDAAIFSFGRDKAISSVFGGAVIANNKNLGEKIKKIQNLAPYPSVSWVYQQLFHPILTSIVLYLFSINGILGKLSIFIFRRIGLIIKPDIAALPQKYPNSLAFLAFSQLARIDEFNKNRLAAFKIYKKELTNLNLNLPTEEHFYLRVPILVDNKEKLFPYFKNHNVYLGDWYSNIIDLKSMGSCPNAEDIAKKIVNLPSYPTLSQKDVQKVVTLLKDYYGNSKYN
ncbi:MAG: DegT/DnrJ/EryC1/StrS aminotransferase family protein [Candidatus Levybacteria bacterium]|nr:DegT/DnrJ/EryC1/StrS aminotransferase family protein [Candidatus Levybacteria bacterium]